MSITAISPSATQSAVSPFVVGRALKSMRDSGFSLAAALGEVIDNAIEANANAIVVDMREVPVDRKRKAVDRIAVVDDGTGMAEEVLHHYLQIGFSTRYMRNDTIGKYGVGATTAALNFATRIDAWSRDSKRGPIRHVALDLDAIEESEEQGGAAAIQPPDDLILPDDLASLFPAGTGTMVVWSKIDRLADGQGAHQPGELHSEIAKELARIFREQLHGGINIRLQHAGNVLDLLPHDPTFRLDKTYADKVLADEGAREHPGGREAWEKDRNRKTHFPATVVFDDDVPVGKSQIHVAVTVYPSEALRTRGKGGDALAKRLRVPENEGMISFLRKGREISYTNVPRIFDSRIADKDRWIGIEVRFDPDLDPMMGVRNVKRGAEPNDDMRVALRNVLKAEVRKARKLIDDHWRQAGRTTDEQRGEHSAVNEAVADANATMPKSRVEPTSDTEVDEAFENLATDMGKTDPGERESYIDRIRALPYVVESVDWPGDQLFEIVHAGQTTIIRLNTRHRFYQEVYAPLRSLSQSDPDAVSGEDSVQVARRAAEAVTLLFIAYAKAESMHEDPDEQYNELRGWWGNFANYLLGKVKDVLD
ncbi:MAG: ATP-binding protein [Acidimicrobiales bacterium]